MGEGVGVAVGDLGGGGGGVGVRVGVEGASCVPDVRLHVAGSELGLDLGFGLISGFRAEVPAGMQAMSVTSNLSPVPSYLVEHGVLRSHQAYQDRYTPRR